MDLEKQYEDWLENLTLPECDDTEKLKEDVENELRLLSSMSNEEYILYLKWLELVDYKIKPTLLSCPHDDIKSQIWVPEEPNDYLKLEPELIFCEGNNVKIWNILRTFTCTLYNNSNIGRNLRFLVVDKITKKYLGVICCSSDFMDLTARDKFIGWSREIKIKNLVHTTIGSSIVPTQPLGYSYLGGKLLALLITSDVVTNKWKEKYGDILAGVTTTSLYGTYSQYNSLKFWNKRGHTTGKIKYTPCKETIKRITNWLCINYPREYWEWYHAKNKDGLPYKRDHKQRSLAFFYRKMGIEKSLYETEGHYRGVYFCSLYHNTNEFLRGEITEDKLVKRFDNSVNNLVEIWKTQYASKRIKKVDISDSLFYNDVIDRDWQYVKKNYLKGVGK